MPQSSEESQTKRVAAIFLPLTGPRADLGKALLQAAQMALSDGSGPVLDVLDTGGTPAGAATAARSALNNGASLILGPLTAGETAAVAPIILGTGIPILAFTNDVSQSQPGVWPLGISPDQQVKRLVAAALAQGKSRFAALLPESDFGRAMGTALSKAAESASLQPPTIRMHSRGMAAITAAARDISGYATRRGPIDVKIKEARALGTPDGRHEAQELAKALIPPAPFDVLVLADTDDALQEIAALLPYYDIDRSRVQIVGPALWGDPTSGSGAVRDAWYAAPDNQARMSFERDYAAKYGSPPPPLTDLAFDAASLGKIVVGPAGSEIAILTQPGGFVGVDGWFVLLPDGQVRRGLGVFRISRAGPELIDPAPQSAASPGL